jgi:hypothetical protein
VSANADGAAAAHRMSAAPISEKTFRISVEP